MKAFKGFNKDMTCRGFEFEEGKTYHEDKAELCQCGFHACEFPLDCFSYYAPNESIFREVELDEVEDKTDFYDNTIRVGKTINIGAELDIAGMVKESIEYVKSKMNIEPFSSGDFLINATTNNWSTNTSNGDRSSNSATGERSANTSTGNYSSNSTNRPFSANLASGYCSVNASTGSYSANAADCYYSVNTSTGDFSANSTDTYESINSSTGYCSVNTSNSDRSINSATGNFSANLASGYQSINTSTGNNCSNEGAEDTLNVGWGKDNKCRGKKGAYIVLAERGKWDGARYPLINVKMGYIDGEVLKEDVWYELKNGEFVEA